MDFFLASHTLQTLGLTFEVLYPLHDSRPGSKVSSFLIGVDSLDLPQGPKELLFSYESRRLCVGS